MANLKPTVLLQCSMVYTVLLVCCALSVTCVPIESHRQLIRRETTGSTSLRQLKAGTEVLRRFMENQLFKMTDANILPARLTNGTFASLSVMQRYVHLIDDGFGGNSAKLTLLSRVLQQVIKDSCVWLVADESGTLDCSNQSEVSLAAFALGLYPAFDHMDKIFPSASGVDTANWIRSTVTEPTLRSELCRFTHISCV